MFDFNHFNVFGEFINVSWGSINKKWKNIKCLHGSPVGREERETLVYMPKVRPQSFDLREMRSITEFFVQCFILFTLVKVLYCW